MSCQLINLIFLKIHRYLLSVIYRYISHKTRKHLKQANKIKQKLKQVRFDLLYIVNNTPNKNTAKHPNYVTIHDTYRPYFVME